MFFLQGTIVIQEIFIESTWEDAAMAQQRRDERYREWEAAGMDCQRENLYTADGRRVFLVTAEPVEPELSPEEISREKSAGPRLRSNRAGRRVQDFEER